MERQWDYKSQDGMIKRNDFILIGILVVAFAIICAAILFFKRDGREVVVSIDGVPSISFPLDENLVYEIEGFNGGKNTLVIENGAAYLTDSTCPDHLCEYMGRISKVGQSIICLPNRVVVEIAGDADEAEYDAVSG